MDRQCKLASARLGGDRPTALPEPHRPRHGRSSHLGAEWLHKRARPIWENSIGPDHPNVVTALENYAALVRAANRADEATKVRAAAIHKK